MKQTELVKLVDAAMSISRLNLSLTFDQLHVILCLITGIKLIPDGNCGYRSLVWAAYNVKSVQLV